MSLAVWQPRRPERQRKKKLIIFRYGPSELTCTGILKDWDTAPVASKIQVPTLLINGQYDEVGDNAVQPFFDTIPRVRWVTLEGASHMAHIEVRERFMEVLAGFLLS